MSSRQWIITISAIGIVALSFFAMNFLGAFKEEPKTQKPKEIVKYVDTTPATYQEIKTKIEAYGRLESALPLNMTAEAQGRILAGKIPLKAGQRFKRGQLLFSIDNREAKYRLQADKAAFLRDIAALLPDMKVDYPERFETWQAYFNQIDVSKPLPQLPEYTSQKEKTFLASKNILGSYYLIKSTEVNLGKHYYYAPFSGSIQEVTFQVGAFVNPGTAVGKIVMDENLELKVPVDVKSTKWLSKGTEVDISSETTLTHWTGRIVRIGDVIDRNTQTLDVYIQIKNNQETPIFDGMYLMATMPGVDIESGMEIPRKALINERYVYTVKYDSILKVAPVQVLKVNKETAVIIGLEEGEDVVIEPLINAYEDMKVKKLSDTASESSKDKDAKVSMN